MTERRRRIIIIIVLILGLVRGNLDASADPSFNTTMVTQLWTVYGLTGQVSPSAAVVKALEAGDALCDAIYASTGDWAALSATLAAKLAAI